MEKEILSSNHAKCQAKLFITIIFFIETVDEKHSRKNSVYEI